MSAKAHLKAAASGPAPPSPKRAMLSRPSILTITILLLSTGTAVYALTIRDRIHVEYHSAEDVDKKLVFHVPSPTAIISVTIALISQYHSTASYPMRGVLIGPSSVALVFVVIMLAFFLEPSELAGLPLPPPLSNCCMRHRQRSQQQPRPRPHRPHPVSAGGPRPRSVAVPALTAWPPALVPAVPTPAYAAPAHREYVQRTFRDEGVQSAV
ncbi:hypothetical protein EVG20_g1746 [Dentipellis fragilis]|uniref:Uncharacterized protein n=1 Tax=Dentipellis fragilis TaxID=205917 RepID=A0A4Y9Z9P0_9AGAM|nr:hypothetical protein EVG20_g1746 [Dentipellis fragilis]